MTNDTPPRDDAPEHPQSITMTYRNYRGEIAERTFIPNCIWWGSTDWHPEPGWLISGLDMPREVQRDFALADCQFADLSRADQPARVVVGYRIRVKSDDPEEWEYMSTAKALDYIDRENIEAQPLSVDRFALLPTKAGAGPCGCGDRSCTACFATPPTASPDAALGQTAGQLAQIHSMLLYGLTEQEQATFAAAVLAMRSAQAALTTGPAPQCGLICEHCREPWADSHRCPDQRADPNCECCAGLGTQADGETPCPCIANAQPKLTIHDHARALVDARNPDGVTVLPEYMRDAPRALAEDRRLRHDTPARSLTREAF